MGPALRHSWSIQSNSSSHSDMQAVSCVAQTFRPDICVYVPLRLAGTIGVGRENLFLEDLEGFMS